MIRNSKFIVQFLPVHFVFYEKIAIFATLTEGSLRHCRIKRGKETRSFLIRSPFDTYPSQTSNNQDFTICEMILCGDLRFSHSQGHRHRPSGEERDTAQYTANTRARSLYRQADGVCQDWRCKALGTSTTK